uniref:Uncharacterized protein n=2 Tax=Lepeophtheirus salmonis TaxID=72036 RepID=A0A0K2U730_LEPSM
MIGVIVCVKLAHFRTLPINFCSISNPRPFNLDVSVSRRASFFGSKMARTGVFVNMSFTSSIALVSGIYGSPSTYFHPMLSHLYKFYSQQN